MHIQHMDDSRANVRKERTMQVVIMVYHQARKGSMLPSRTA